MSEMPTGSWKKWHAKCDAAFFGIVDCAPADDLRNAFARICILLVRLNSICEFHYPLVFSLQKGRRRLTAPDHLRIAFPNGS